MAALLYTVVILICDLLTHACDDAGAFFEICCNGMSRPFFLFTCLPRGLGQPVPKHKQITCL